MYFFISNGKIFHITELKAKRSDDFMLASNHAKNADEIYYLEIGMKKLLTPAGKAKEVLETLGEKLK